MPGRHRLSMRGARLFLLFQHVCPAEEVTAVLLASSTRADLAPKQSEPEAGDADASSVMNRKPADTWLEDWMAATEANVRFQRKPENIAKAKLDHERSFAHYQAERRSHAEQREISLPPHLRDDGYDEVDVDDPDGMDNEVFRNVCNGGPSTCAAAQEMNNQGNSTSDVEQRGLLQKLLKRRGRGRETTIIHL